MTNIRVFECCQCERQFAQKKWVCPNCKNAEFKLTEVNGKGKVFSSTRIHVTSQEFAHLTPYTVALVELPNGMRVTGRISEPVEINDEVTCISNEENTYVFSKN